MMEKFIRWMIRTFLPGYHLAKNRPQKARPDEKQGGEAT